MSCPFQAFLLYWSFWLLRFFPACCLYSFFVFPVSFLRFCFSLRLFFKLFCKYHYVFHPCSCVFKSVSFPSSLSICCVPCNSCSGQIPCEFAVFASLNSLTLSSTDLIRCSHLARIWRVNTGFSNDADSGLHSIQIKLSQCVPLE